MLNNALKQIQSQISERDLARHYRIGPAKRPYDDPSYTHAQQAFPGIGLRPLSVCHLRALQNATGDYLFNWVRRTRIDGDSWSGFDVPLGELRELYLLRVMQGSVRKREVTLGTPGWNYTQTMKVADGLVGQGFTIEVAQISDAFGAGPFTGMVIND